MKLSVGCLYVCIETGRVLLLLDNFDKKFGKVWSLMAGGIEDNESVVQALKRESEEELGIDPDIADYYFVDRDDDDGSTFNFYIGVVDEEFEPRLSHEHLKAGWFDKEELPDNMYPGLKQKIDDL